uniref:Uncharacterized protein n=1 Tax=Mustela putorius furo TaxID=9669 RepID=M3Z1U2_MUSPF
MRSDDLILTSSPKKQVYSFFATRPLLRLKGNASVTPPTSVFSTLNSPRLASFCLWPCSLLERFRIWLQREKLRQRQAPRYKSPPLPRPAVPVSLSIPFLSPSPGAKIQAAKPHLGPSRHRTPTPPSFSLLPPLGGRGTGREPSRSLPSRRSARRGSSAAPVAKATRSAARCGRQAAQRRRCGPAARARRGGGTAETPRGREGKKESRLHRWPGLLISLTLKREAF